ncbi:MAG: YraN family protein [Gammaproteobacteria bacterium]|nr:YraN family protein [Gammaproteobacteria bacterium]MCW5582711.1 YraN family protein [Gammaproteobacteria bacterium]
MRPSINILRATMRHYLGKQAEREASKFLQAKGLRLLEQNYHCRYGEIDLIMHDQHDIVFVEVRSRSRTDFGKASETVNKNKQKKLIKTATHFLQTKQWWYKVNSRFDIIAIHYESGKQQLEWIKNAFSVTS